jgi:hypothetical protein
VRRLTSNSVASLEGRTPEEFVTGSTPDISPYVMLNCYQPVYYLTLTIEFPFKRKTLGRWLVVAENCTDEITRYLKRTHKFGIAMPKSVPEAIAFDKWSGTDFWQKAIEKEILNVMPAFEFRDDD